MQLFILVLTKGEYMPQILKHLSDHNYHGTVMPTMSIKDALLHNDIDPAPMFGGISKVVNYSQSSRPMLFIVTKEDAEVKEIFKLVDEACDGVSGKGFMYSLPVNEVEGV